ncbi:MAG: hypothetical protein IPQ07_40255 [Myxococcales bacterium]|nr:hypothetical protein [Myxococcales bacterium]
MFYEYDTKGRLLRIKRRDDCLLASAGDRQELLYDSEGLVTEVDTYDSAGVLTAKQPYTYFDSRRLEKALNPVDVTKWTGLTYDARGLLTQVDGAGGLGKTVYNRTGLPGSEGRVTSVDKYSSVAGSALDSWNLLYDWIGNQFQVTDGDIKATQTERDDLGRVTRLVSPDQTYPIASLYDAASRVTLRTEAFGGGAVQRRTSNTFDNLGRPLVVDYLDSSCFGATLPETERIYDAPPGGTCPIVGACSHTEGRLAYVRMTFACGGDSNTYDQETFYGYDEAGRQISETIRDNIVMPMLPPRQQLFSWTKNGALAQMTTPSGAILGWTYGSAASNSDADLITAQWRTSVATPVTSAVTWNPFGPLKQYNQQNTLTSIALRTRITRNLAYRPTGLFVETQTGGTVAQSVVLAEDVKGRITKRDYTPNTGGVQDSYFRYDDQDRVLCETTNLVASCPTSGATIKNVHSASPPFTHAGDWKKILRPSPGTTGLTNDINAAGYGTSHRVTTVNQSDGTPVLGTTSIGYDANGDRISDDNAGLAYDNRAYFHDQRHNFNTAWIDFKLGGSLSQLQSYSGFDARNRRMSKTVWNATPGIAATWDYYYDPYDRLTEIRYVPNYAVPATYSIFQLFWLEDRLTAYWQTDYPAVATTKRYVGTDETSRPIHTTSRLRAATPRGSGRSTQRPGAATQLGRTGRVSAGAVRGPVPGLGDDGVPGRRRDGA